jgi:hypothetical protein
MGIFDWLFKPKTSDEEWEKVTAEERAEDEDDISDEEWDKMAPEQQKAEILEKLRKNSIIKERRSSMHEMLVNTPGIENQDIHPKGSGKFGLELTNPIPVYGIDNIPAYMDKLRNKKITPSILKEGENITTYHPIQYIRTSDSDNSKIGSGMPSDGRLVAFAKATPLGNIDVYNLYSLNGEKLAKIYVNSYSLKTSDKVPDGFFNRDEIPATQDSKATMEFMKNYKR